MPNKRRHIRFDNLVPAQNLGKIAPDSPWASRLREGSPEMALVDTLGKEVTAADLAGAVSMPTMMVRKRPADMSLRDWAIYLLHNAALIEHALMIQYLYAAYSLNSDASGKDASDPTITVNASTWANTISKIAIEEMGHLLTVQNILRFVGGSITFMREDFPIDTAVYPFPFELEPLTKDVLAKYVYAEMPEGDIPEDVLKPTERADIEKAARKAVPSGGSFLNHVGTLYATLLDVFADPAFQAPATSGFPPASDTSAVTYQGKAQADADGVGWPNLLGNGTIKEVDDAGNPVTVQLKRPRLLWVNSIGDVLKALSFIARQGEASDMNQVKDSHFGRFLPIYRSFPKEKDPGWPTPPALPVPTNPTTNSQPNTPSSIDHPLSKLWAQLFDVRYRMLLGLLTHATAIPNVGDPGGGSPIEAIVGRIFDVMAKGDLNLSDLAKFLVRMPRSDASKPENAGAPFTMPYTTAIPNRPGPRWQFHLDLLDSADRLMTAIAKQAPDPKVPAFTDAAAKLAGMRSADATWRAQVIAFRDSLKPGTCDNV